MAQKQNYLLAAIVVALAVIAIESQAVPYGNNNYAAANKSHHLIVGTRMPGDRLSLRENLIKSSSWMKVVVIQKTFSVSPYERITLVNALDQKTNGNGAYASILNGGPGHNNVTLKLKSQRGHGINFVVELYSRH